MAKIIIDGTEVDVPPEFTLDGKAVGWNTDLSDMDKAFIATVYPKPAPPMDVGGSPVPAMQFAPMPAASPAPNPQMRVRRTWT